jgi:hypothetical protein
MDFRETGWRSVEWFHVALYRDSWRDPVNTVMNTGFWHHEVWELVSWIVG